VEGNGFYNADVDQNIYLEGYLNDPVWINGYGEFYSSNNLIEWYVRNGNEPVPSGTITYTARSLGSPTSTIVTVPSGSISGNIITSTANTDNVISWTDQSGNGIVLTPDIQNAPTFVSSFLNGKPAIEFIVGSNTGLSNTSFGLTGFTFFSVTKQKPTNTGRIFSSYFGNVLIGTWGNYSNRFYGGGSNGWLAEGTQTSTDFLITTAFSDADTSFDFSQNGVSQFSGASNSTVILNGISVGGGIWNGGNEEASDSYVCEIVIYNRTLSSTERQQVEAYLNNKYNVIPSINNMFLPQLWLKADAGVTLDGSNVTAWADQSGNGKNVNQSNGYASATTFGGKSFVSFPIGADLINNNGIWPSGSTIDYGTIIIVARFPSSHETVQIAPLLFSHGNLNIGRGNDQTYPDGLIATKDYDTNIFGNSNLSNNTNYLIGMTFNLDSLTLYLNGSTNGSGANFENSGNDEFTIGQFQNGEPFSIAEIVVYNRVLSTIERQQVETYLNQKYAIY